MTFIILLLSLGSLNALAFKNAPKINPLIPRKLNHNETFQGIVKLHNCSGSMVLFKGAPLSNKALIMTNGHCLSELKANPNMIITNKPYKDKVGIFNKYGKLKKIKITKIIFATTINTDVAFLETNLSYLALKNNYHIKPFILNDTLPDFFTPIDVISGYWELVTSCEIESIAPLLKEGNYFWKESIRYSSQCKTKGGFSGSPVIEKNTRTILGVHNTGNNGVLDCSKMNPCELNLQGELIFNEPNRRYAQQVYQFYDCLNSDYKIDLKTKACGLDVLTHKDIPL